MNLFEVTRAPVDPVLLSPPLPRPPRRPRDPLIDTLQGLLPTEGHVLELASGSGRHVNELAQLLPAVEFEPTDVDTDVFPTILAHRLACRNRNVAEPYQLDIVDPGTWPGAQARRFDAILAINLLQDAPLLVTAALFALASQLLAPQGKLLVAGPFVGGSAASPAGAAELTLEIQASRLPQRGPKAVRDIEAAARRQGLTLADQLLLPGLEQVLVFAHG